MELNKIPYIEIHQTVLSVMKKRHVVMPDERLFLVIGAWYYRWHLLNLPELALKVPIYRKHLLLPLIEYLYWVDLLVKLLECKHSNDFTEYALFDIRTYRAADNYNKRNKNFDFEYLRSQSRAYWFDREVVVSTDRFLPLFRSEQIPSYKKLLDDLFCLLDGIGRTNLIPNAICLDFEKDLTLFVKESKQDLQTRAFSKILHTDILRNDHKLRNRVLDDMKDADIRNCLVFTYPYNVAIGSTIINEFRGRTKMFRLELSARFCHEVISEETLALTRAECGAGNNEDVLDLVDSYDVLNTSCDPALVFALRELKHEWNRARFNVFTTPFPTKWLMCIHKGQELIFWNEQLRKDFPELSGKLLADMINIIGRVYELDWIGNFLPRDRSATVLLPKSRGFQDVINSLKNHLDKVFKHVGYSDEPAHYFKKDATILLMDPFNVILLNNISIYRHSPSLKIIVPDFLYFTHQPFIRYHVLKYHFEALIGGARAIIDDNYKYNVEKWERLSAKLLQLCRENLSNFNQRNAVKDEQEDESLLLQQPELKFEFSPSELLDHIVLKERRISSQDLSANIEITTVSNKKLLLRSNTAVLIKENDYLIRSIAAILERNSIFVQIDQIYKDIDIKKMVDRLVTLSDKAMHWHQNLYALDQIEYGLFEKMKKDGLTVAKGTFEKDYLLNVGDEDELHIPRAKIDWNIVCNWLGIDDRQTAWNAVKCREDITRLKTIYVKIIELMGNTGSFGINVSDCVVDQIAALLSALPDASVNEKEKKKDAVALIAEISEKITMEQVQQIKVQIT